MDMSMPMPTSSPTSSSSMPMSMTMSTMSMTFFTSTTTPLFSLSWTPHTAGQYTGTCIFLIFLAAIFRALVAIRFNLLDVLAYFRGYPEQEEDMDNGEKGEGGRMKRKWRAGEAVWIAGLDVGVAGVSYLLMVAVMTMNVGYFMSVLAGVFLGSLVCARFMSRATAH